MGTSWLESVGAWPTVDDSHASSDTPKDAAQESWVLAPLIAGANAMRFATRNGKYPLQRNQSAPPIGKTLPRRAVAVMIHGADGSVATLCLDLDTSKAPQDIVDSDADGIRTMLTSCGLRFVADHSPSGGRHIYVPLGKRLAHEDARELVEALALRFRSLDPSPHRNIVGGCIRPPGSWHKTMTGHQVLDTPLSQAYDVMVRRNPESSVAALRLLLAGSIHKLRVNKSSRAANIAASAINHLPRAAVSKVSALWETARTGLYDKARYKSHSEARLAVLNSMANTNITLDEIRHRFNADFGGLRSLYANDKEAGRLLGPEWSNAQQWVARKTPTKQASRKSSLKNDTEPALTHGGGCNSPRSEAAVMQEINDLENVLYAVLDHRLAKSGREGISLRMLLRAVIGFARTRKSLVIDVGCRSFALEMGRHHSTIARLLPRLEKLTEGLVERVELARGRDADVYVLTVPAQWLATAKALSWRKGKIYGMRPVFWALGDVAALAYETIERQKAPSSTADIVRATGIGRTAVDKALTTMVELAMIERHHGNWRLRKTTVLRQIAEALGVHQLYELRKLRIKAERRAWHARLERHHDPIYEEDIHDPEIDAWIDQHPPDDEPYQPPLHKTAAA